MIWSNCWWITQEVLDSGRSVLTRFWTGREDALMLKRSKVFLKLRRETWHLISNHFSFQRAFTVSVVGYHHTEVPFWNFLPVFVCFLHYRGDGDISYNESFFHLIHNWFYFVLGLVLHWECSNFDSPTKKGNKRNEHFLCCCFLF